MLAAIRTLNRLENVGETLRATLNAVTSVAPGWLREHAEPAWFDRYGHRIEESRLPKGHAERQQYAELIGTDGSQLLSMLYEPSAPAHLKELPAVQLLRQTWVFQYYTNEGQLRWRKAEDLPPAGMRSDSPYDPDTHRLSSLPSTLLVYSSSRGSPPRDVAYAGGSRGTATYSRAANDSRVESAL